jgi:zinc transporter ZupT
MSVFEYFLLFVPIAIASALPFFFKRISKNVIKLVLSFGGAYLLAISSLHLLPEAFSEGSVKVGYFVLGGFFLQLFLEQLSKGVEHGHIHPAHKPETSFALSVMTGLCVHAFIEGLPLHDYGTFHEAVHHGTHHHNFFLFGIIFHHLPAALALSILLLSSGFSKTSAGILLLLFAVMTPVGALVGTYFEFSPMQIRYLTALVIGIFLHISTTILFEMEENASHSLSWRRLLAIVLGTGFGLLTTF